MGIENSVILLFGFFLLAIVGQNLFRDFSLKGFTDGVLCWLAVVAFFAIAGGLEYLAKKYGKGKVIVYSAFIVLAVAAVLSFGLNMLPNPAPPPIVESSSPGIITAICRDGSCSYSHSRSGTCANHGGVRQWMTGPSNYYESAKPNKQNYLHTSGSTTYW